MTKQDELCAAERKVLYAVSKWHERQILSGRLQPKADKARRVDRVDPVDLRLLDAYQELLDVHGREGTKPMTTKGLQHLGDVLIDSGELLIIDPAYLHEHEHLERSDESPTQLLLPLNGERLAVTLCAGFEETLRAVYVHSDDDGDPTHVVISLDGEEH